MSTNWMTLWRQNIVPPLVAITCLLIPVQSYASAEEVTFDLSADSSAIQVWIDLSFLLSSKSVDLLSDGIEYVVEVNLELVRPRRLYGTTLISESVDHLHIKYFLITKEYQLDINQLRKDSRTLRFTTLGSLHRFLADSVTFEVNHKLDLNSARRYEINLEITSIWLTSFNLRPSGESAKASESTLQYLFTQFLHLTGYGRETATVRSRNFRLSELSTQKP